MMAGQVLHTPGGQAYVHPDTRGDPRAWIPQRMVDDFDLKEGQTVLYVAQKTRDGWEATHMRRLLSSMSPSPSDWRNGRINQVNRNYCFIHPDDGPPNVMCLPSAIDQNYSPQVGDRVLFRAGPSEKAPNHKHQRAINVRRPPPWRATRSNKRLRHEASNSDVSYDDGLSSDALSADMHR